MWLNKIVFIQVVYDNSDAWGCFLTMQWHLNVVFSPKGLKSVGMLCDLSSDAEYVTHFRYIQSTCATSGEGLYEGLDWLSSNIASKVCFWPDGLVSPFSVQAQHFIFTLLLADENFYLHRSCVFTCLFLLCARVEISRELNWTRESMSNDHASGIIRVIKCLDLCFFVG